MPVATASQTVGPYWGLIDDPTWADLLRFGATGDTMTLTGRITDGDGLPVTDAAVEIWQAAPAASELFPAYGRSATDLHGEFRFRTLKPEPVPGLGNAQQAPHFAVTLLARGLLKALVTRAYFEGNALNDNDPVLSMIEDPARRRTLLARHEGTDVWRMDIVLQGAGETVFLDV